MDGWRKTRRHHCPVCNRYNKGGSYERGIQGACICPDLAKNEAKKAAAAGKPDPRPQYSSCKGTIRGGICPDPDCPHPGGKHRQFRRS